MNNRVVVTGLGVVAPNGNGLAAYESALREMRSGIRSIERLKELNFGCHVGGVPQDVEALMETYFSVDERQSMNSGIAYGGIAGIDCWRDAGFEVPDANTRESSVDWDAGAIIGTGVGGLDTLGDTAVPQVAQGRVRRLGSTMVERIMASGVSARLGGLLGLGGQVSSNSSACTTGTEALINGYYSIKEGRAKRVLVGGAEGYSPYHWAGFDAMRVLNRKKNDVPHEASRPMSASAAGFVPSAGAGVLMLENLESARSRSARIYAEVLGGHVNCGGQRGSGSMTAPNPAGVQRCIRKALLSAQTRPESIDLINGHLTATMADVGEVRNWSSALELPPERLPIIQATKSLLGHALGAAGGLELVASVLQLYRGFIHGSMNCEDLHEGLKPFQASIRYHTVEVSLRVMAKASFGFGDVNGCAILQSWNP